VRSREVLAEALIHSLRGLDEEGLAHLHEADRLALEDDDPISSAQARAELGYVDFLRARYDRAELWLTESLALSGDSPSVRAKATTYLGSVHSDLAIETLLDARTRSNRLADPYVWLDAHILDALCELGLRHGHPDTRSWSDAMRELTSRTGMRELTVRAMLHSAALGNAGDASAAALLAADIDNPMLHALM
jgi:hypothetical protein